MNDETGFAPFKIQHSPFSFSLRPYRDGDQADIVRHANNPNVARHLRDLFPQPYTLQDANDWIARVVGQSPPLNLAITLDDRFIGGIGLAPGSDIHRISAEVGYWLGEEFWGRGIVASALRGFTQYAFATLPGLNRIFAYVDEDHPPSIRVLEKAAYRREGHLLGASIKHGQIRNQFLYAITRPEAVQGRESLAAKADP